MLSALFFPSHLSTEYNDSGREIFPSFRKLHTNNSMNVVDRLQFNTSNNDVPDGVYNYYREIMVMFPHDDAQASIDY